MEDHRHHPETGQVIVAEPAEVEPAAAEAEAVEEVAEAEVEIAKIEADRDVAIAKESTKQMAEMQNDELAELRAEVRALREVVDALKPAEPEPPAEPVVVVQEPPAEPPADVPPPAEVEEKPTPKKKSGLSWF